MAKNLLLRNKSQTMSMRAIHWRWWQVRGSRDLKECAEREIFLKKQDWMYYKDGDERNHHLPEFTPGQWYVCLSGDGVFRRAD